MSAWPVLMIRAERSRFSPRIGIIPEAAELVKAGFVVVVPVFLVVSGVFWVCGTRSRGPGAAPAAQRGRTAWRLARMAQYWP